MSAVVQWAENLKSWAIPSEILEQAPTSPWIHPPALFDLPKTIQDSPSHTKARECQPASVLDIGCGGGVAAFALTDLVSHVMGVDHQVEMLAMFAKHAEERKLAHQEFLGDWPDVAESVPKADVVTCHHVVYNVQDIKPFLFALNEHANKRVIIELPQHHPLSMSNLAWRHFWNLERPAKPTSDDFLAVVRECGFDAQAEHWNSPMIRATTFEDEVTFTRIRLCLPQSRDPEIAQFLAAQTPTKMRAVSTIWWDV